MEGAMIEFKPYKVSIIIPIFNSHGVVRRQLLYFRNLVLPDSVEIIFMDDGSSPPLKDYFAGHKVRNLNIYPTGDSRPWTQPCAKNLGVLIAQGEFVFITDVDHILTREAIEAVLAFDGDKMEFPREYAILNNHGMIWREPEVLFKYGLDRNHFRKKGLTHYHHTNTFAMRRRIFIEIGGYPSRLCNMGIHNIYDDNILYGAYRRYARHGGAKPAVWGPPIFTFPGVHLDPKKLFHSLPRFIGAKDDAIQTS